MAKVSLALALLCLLAERTTAAWAPTNYNDFRCFDNPVFDERKGEKAPRHVNDPRITAAVQTFLKDTANGVRFFGHSVPNGTAGETVPNDTSNVGWIRKGSAEDALIIEANNWREVLFSKVVNTVVSSLPLFF